MNSGLKLPFQFVYKPLWNRVKLGEGGLVVFNLFHAAFYTRSITATILETAFSMLVITLLYGFNDYQDREVDRCNPKKEKTFVEAINQHSKFYLGLHIGISLLCLLTAFFWGGVNKGIVLIALFAVNIIYSLWLKAFLIGDLLIVILWGGLFALLAGPSNAILATITGLMTGMAHIFQMKTDQPYDQANNVQTTAVRFPAVIPALFAALCLTTGILLNRQLNLWWGLSAALPLFFYLVGSNLSLAWHAARLYFFICWIMLLNTVYGGF